MRAAAEVACSRPEPLVLRRAWRESTRAGGPSGPQEDGLLRRSCHRRQEQQQPCFLACFLSSSLPCLLPSRRLSLLPSFLPSIRLSLATSPLRMRIHPRGVPRRGGSTAERSVDDPQSECGGGAAWGRWADSSRARGEGTALSTKEEWSGTGTGTGGGVARKATGAMGKKVQKGRGHATRNRSSS